MTLNTINDFLKTANPNHDGIICPSCGSVLGVRKQGTYNMTLTDKARLELDEVLSAYRSFIRDVEEVLEHINIIGIRPYDKAKHSFRRIGEDYPELNARGTYRNTQGSKIVEDFIKKHLDYFDWSNNFYKFIRQNKLQSALQNRSQQEQTELQQIHGRCRDTLLGGLEPPIVSGPIIDLIFEQRFVKRWMQGLQADQTPLNALLTEVCPKLQFYLDALAQLDKIIKQPGDPDLAEGVLRVKLILAILLGHQSEQHIQTMAPLGIRTKVPFTLPRLTLVSPRLLHQLICSEVVLGKASFGWDSKIVEAIRTIPLQQPGVNPPNSLPTSGNQPDITALVSILGKKIPQFVNFACTGLVGEKPQIRMPGVTQIQDWEVNQCGWYPKAEKTHSIVFYGSPGSSKSTVMLTGLTTFYRQAAVLGANISFESPDDEARMKELDQAYSLGKMPSPTAQGARKSIKLSIEFVTDAYSKANFVFTDIPGEVAARSLTEEGSDPSVLRILKNAETIVFFFDLSIEPLIRETLTKGDVNQLWKQLADNYKRTNDDRMGASEVSQLQLLQKLIRDLKAQKGAEQLLDTRILCVIPKSDLFVDENNSRSKFLTPLYSALEQSQVLVPSRQYERDGFDGLYSLGGTGSQLQLENRVESQKEIAQLISDKAVACLRNIGDAIEDDDAWKALRTMLSDALEVRLISMLTKTFGQQNTYFLPVSAQGEDNSSKEFGHPPNQKLSEYVFMLPIALSAEKAA
jgi:hypothetical protein